MLEIVMALSKAVKCTSSIQTEAIAARFGTKCFVEKGISSFTIKINITDMLKNMSTMTLKLKQIIYYTIRGVSNANVNFIYCYREANMVADYFAKMTSTSGNVTYFSSWQSLPNSTR